MQPGSVSVSGRPVLCPYWRSGSVSVLVLRPAVDHTSAHHSLPLRRSSMSGTVSWLSGAVVYGLHGLHYHLWICTLDTLYPTKPTKTAHDHHLL